MEKPMTLQQEQSADASEKTNKGETIDPDGQPSEEYGFGPSQAPGQEIEGRSTSATFSTGNNGHLRYCQGLGLWIEVWVYVCPRVLRTGVPCAGLRTV